VQRWRGRPTVYLLTRALATDDFAAVRDRVRRELPAPGRRTLDLACGPGLFADLFLGEDYVGVDANPRHIEYARRHRPGAFLAGGLRHLGLPDGRFDQALAFAVFEHMTDGAVLAALAEVRRLLVPGGRLLVIAELPAAGPGARLRQVLLGPVTRGPEAYRRLLAAAGTVERAEAFRSGWTSCLAVPVTRGSAG
jgi:SAM-dependent methyltransferase